MPNTTTNLGLLQPLVNNPTDQDLWGTYLNTNFGNLDAFLLTTLNWTSSSQTSTITVTIPTAGSVTTGSARLLYLCNATSGAFAANLPAASTAAGLTVAFKKTDASANAITITGNASDKIDGSGTYSLSSQYSYIVLVCDGAAWNIIAQTPPILAVSPLTTVLGVDINMINASTYYDIATISQGSVGTWAVSASITVTNTAAASSFDAKLWDGATIIASGHSNIYLTAAFTTISLSGFITAPAGNLRISVQCEGNTTGVVKFNASGNSKDSVISAFRIL